jgi:hypothetical protein
VHSINANHQFNILNTKLACQARKQLMLATTGTHILVQDSQRVVAIAHPSIRDLGDMTTQCVVGVDTKIFQCNGYLSAWKQSGTSPINRWKQVHNKGCSVTGQTRLAWRTKIDFRFDR